jgi:hypothetical protein
MMQPKCWGQGRWRTVESLDPDCRSEGVQHSPEKAVSGDVQNAGGLDLLEAFSVAWLQSRCGIGEKRLNRLSFSSSTREGTDLNLAEVGGALRDPLSSYWSPHPYDFAQGRPRIPSPKLGRGELATLS